MKTYASRRTALGLLALVALAASGFVALSPRGVAGPQKGSARCCSSPGASFVAARQQTALATGTGPQAEAVYPPGVIDGAKHPEMIPDEVAYRILFLSLIEPENPSDAQKARQAAKLRKIGLSEEDKAVFLARLGDFRDGMGDLGARTGEILKATPRPLPGSAERLELAEIGAESKTLLAGTVEQLRSGLSQEGFDKLQAHVLDFKRTIKRFPAPSMPDGQ